MGIIALSQRLLFTQSATATVVDERVMEIAVENEICDANNVCETVAGTVQVKLKKRMGYRPEHLTWMAFSYHKMGIRSHWAPATSKFQLNVEQFNDNPPVTTVNAIHSGPEAQLRVTNATTVYVDTTNNLNQPLPS